MYSNLLIPRGRERKDFLFLEQDLRRLEESFLQPARSQLENVERLLAEDFLEIGASGRTYDKKQTLQALLGKSSVHCPMLDFKICSLSVDVVLTTYRIIQPDAPKDLPVCSLRSSVWKKIDDRWQIVFHQGTFVMESMK